MSMDAISLAKDFSIFDPSILSEEDKANQRRFPTPKEFVDSVSVGGGDINLDELGKSYTRHYKDYVTKSVGLSPALADAKALAIQNMFFTGKDTIQFNDAWGSILNPQQAQAQTQEQAKAAQGDAGHLDNIARGYYQQSAGNFVSSAMDDMAQVDSATRVRAGQDWLTNQTANGNSQLVMGGGNQAVDLNKQLSEPLPIDPYGGIAQTNEASALQNIQQAQIQLDKANALPESKGVNEFSKTEGFFDAAGHLIINPLDTALPLIEQSLSPMASQLGAAAVGGVVGGIPGAMVAGGATSYDVNRAAKILEEAQKTGRPLIDVVRDAQVRGEIQGEASRYATIVGAADALSMGAAGVTMPARTLLRRGAMQAGLQAFLGGAGEAGGQIAATGEITSGRDIAAEALLEIPFGAAEVGIAALNRPRPQADRTPPNESSNRQGLGTTTVTPQPIQPNANPLSQFAQQVPQPQAAPQANQPALLPSKAQSHPDDVYYVDQAGRTQYGNADIPRAFGGSGLTGQAVRSKSIGDLIASGEGDYQSFNRGKAGDAAGEKIDFSQMTVAELMQRQALPEGNPDRIFTVGKYQAIPSTFAEAVQKLGIPADTKVTPALQEYIFSEYLLKDKRPDIRDYITGKSDSLKDAQKAGAMEWAAIADPDTGLSFHGKVGNNKASISADAFGSSLSGIRQAYADAVSQGANPDEAWSRAVNSTSSNTPLPSIRTSTGFQNTLDTPPTTQLDADIGLQQQPDIAKNLPQEDPANDIELVAFDTEKNSLVDEWRKKRQLSDLVNQEVNYQGVTGFLVRNNDGFVVVGENGNTPIESSMSGRTADSLGVVPLGTTELGIPEKSVVTTDFSKNAVSIYGKNYQYVSANSDKDGITQSINVAGQDGKSRVIRNSDIVNLIEAEKIAHELDQNHADSAEAIQAIRNRTQAIKADTPANSGANAPVETRVAANQWLAARNQQNQIAQQALVPTENTPAQPQQLPDMRVINTGKKGVIYDADNKEHEVNYEVVDAADLSPAQDKAFNQNRDRTRNEAQRQVDSIIKNPVYGRLNMQHSTFTDGAPVLMSDNTVIAGNGRVMGIQGAYKAGTARQYKSQLINDLKAQGVDTTFISQMRAPILVRRLDGNNVNIDRLASLSNKPTTLDLSASEQAAIDAGYIRTLHDFNPDDTGEVNLQSAYKLFQRLRSSAPDNERNSIMTNDGKIGADGVRRVRNALLYMAYGDSKALQDLTESGNQQHLNVTKALIKASPVIAELKDSIKQGIIFDADITPYLIDAFAIFSQVKKSNTNTIDSWLSQQDAFNEVAPETKELLKRLDEATRRPNQLTQFLINYAEKLKAYGSPSQVDIFGNNQPNRMEIINRAGEDARESAASGQGIESGLRGANSNAVGQVAEQSPLNSYTQASTRRGETLNQPSGNYNEEQLSLLPDNPRATIIGRSISKRSKPDDLPIAAAINQARSDSLPGVFGTIAKLIIDKTYSVGVDQVNSKADAAHIFERILGNRTREALDVIVTGKKGKVIAVQRMTSGTIDASSAYPGDIIRFAMSLDGAEAFLVGHNHPSGNPSFSDSDLRITQKISSYANKLRIQFGGMFAIGKGKYSFTIDGNSESSDILPNLSHTKKIVVVEHVLDQRNELSQTPIDSPERAIQIVGNLSNGENSIILLNHRHYPVAVIPFDPTKHRVLTNNKKASDVLASVARSNAAAIIYTNSLNDKEYVGNLTALLDKVSVRVLDHIAGSIAASQMGDFEPRKQDALYNISPRQTNLTGNDTALTTAWKLIASQDDAFQLPISNKNTLGEIAADYDPAFKVRLLEDTKQKRQWVIDVPSKKGRTPVFVTEGKGKNKAIYIDISNFEPGEGGRTIYQMIGDYAHNTGKVFIGDPNGLSAIAQIRRTENMLSSALRWGTTDHLQPHELQLKPDSSKVIPLQWKVGNTGFNIDQYATG